MAENPDATFLVRKVNDGQMFSKTAWVKTVLHMHLKCARAF